MSTKVKHLKNGSVIEGEEIFLVSMLGQEIIELLNELPSAVLVPRGNITSAPLEHLFQHKDLLVSAYIKLSEEEAMLFSMKYA